MPRPVSDNPCEFRPHLRQLQFKFEDAANADEGHPLAGHLRNPLHPIDVRSAVPTLSALRASRLHDLFSVETPDERDLHIEHLGDLPDSEPRRMVIIERVHGRNPRPRRPAGELGPTLGTDPDASASDYLSIPLERSLADL
jgi:hypothetical protein